MNLRLVPGFVVVAALLLAAPLTAAPSGFVPVAREGDALAAPPLVDMSGAAYQPQRGVVVLSFIYTRCADPRMCPAVGARFGRMSRLLAGTPIRLLEVTLDPAYDVPAVLRRYGGMFGVDGRRWTLATGEPAALAGFAERAGLVVERPRPGTLLHTEAVLIARDGIVERIVPGNEWTADEIAAEARSVASLPADPVARFALRAFGGLAALCGGVARGITPAVSALLFVALLALAWYAAHRLLRALLA